MLGKDQHLRKDDVKGAYARLLLGASPYVFGDTLTLIDAPGEIVRDRARFTMGMRHIADALRELFTGNDTGCAATAVLRLSQRECRLTFDTTRAGRVEYVFNALGPYKILTPKNGGEICRSQVSFEELCYHMNTPELAYSRICQLLNEAATQILAEKAREA